MNTATARKILLLAPLVAGGVGVVVALLVGRELRIDDCLDHGGHFDFQAGICVGPTHGMLAPAVLLVLVPEGPGGLVGIPLTRIGASGDPPHAVTASGVHEQLYAVVADPAQGEVLVTRPLAAVGASTLPLRGVDATGTPRAVAYRYRDQALYLLDELHTGSGQVLRLVRVERTGRATELARVPYLGLHDLLFLAVNDPGELVLSASSTKLDETMFLTLEPDAASVRMTGWLTRPGRLLAEPDARAETAYTAIVRRKPKGPVEYLLLQGSDFHRLPPKSQGHPSPLFGCD